MTSVVLRNPIKYVQAAPWLWCWLLAALVAIFQHGPMPMYSTRTLSVAWEMWIRDSFLVPYLNGIPYSDKPPLLLWLIHLGWAVGGVGDVWPRLLEVALGAVQLLLVHHLARRLFPERPALAHAAPWMLAAFSFAFLFGLQVMYEVLLADGVLLAFLCLVPTSKRQSPRLTWFALAVGLGLLSKGPVMFLHVVPPLLLGPWWNEWARANKTRWYLGGMGALVAGSSILLAWVLLATSSGGEAYSQKLVVHQTAGRVVDAFAHAQPFWWYLPLVPVLLLPFALWPRMWLSMVTLRRPWDMGVRFLAAWIVPAFIGFSIVSGKQPYYLLPELGGLALLVTYGLDRAANRFDSPWLGPWPVALASAAVGVTLIALGPLVRSGYVTDHTYTMLVPYSVAFGMLFVLLAIPLARSRRGQVQGIAVVGLIALVAAHGMFSLTLWPAYDFTPVAKMIAKAESAGEPIANLESNDGQYTFLGRLQKPVTQLHGMDEVKRWADTHPNGLIITYPRRLSDSDREDAVYIQPFRGIWLAILPVRAFENAQAKQ
ncbi:MULTISPECIES: ArnT family glycosyltransferase [Dyella]|uniref:Glycosyl transferase n=2 Tax=Dyella TaxID=231454 RepID=A0A4R0YWW7_9GAMM|nr:MULTISPECIES: glycosyltransferase family 39 protein [Dyella]TBR40589.1 glycosyl transferase [Dyella terrae]TCI11829.1 glycosyl transferase [Dyella soli]